MAVGAYREELKVFYYLIYNVYINNFFMFRKSLKNQILQQLLLLNKLYKKIIILILGK